MPDYKEEPRIVMLEDADSLDDYLAKINELGEVPNAPLVDSAGQPWMTYGMAPSGDDWVIGYDLRDPDTGVEHCHYCSGCYELASKGCNLLTGKVEDYAPKFPVFVLEPYKITVAMRKDKYGS